MKTLRFMGRRRESSEFLKPYTRGPLCLPPSPLLLAKLRLCK